MTLLKDHLLVLIALLTMILTLIPDLPAWVLAASFLLGLIRIMSELKWIPLAPRLVTNAFSLLSLIFIYIEHDTLIGQEASSSMLVLLTSLKMWETRTKRDLRFLQILGLALVSVKYLFSYDLWIMIPTTISIFLLLASLITQPKIEKEHFFWLFKTLGIGLPFATILFLVFPRNQTPITLGQRSSVASIGFSGDLKPGTFSELLQSNELVLRINFNNKAPDLSDFYFRGTTLSTSEGLSWSKSQVTGTISPRYSEQADLQNWDYEVIQEPHQNRWLFVFDGTSEIQTSELYRIPEPGIFSLSLAQTKRINFKGRLSNDLAHRFVSNSDLDNYLQTPVSSNRLQEWVRSELIPLKSRLAKVQKLADHLRLDQFRYQTTDIQNVTLDQFFFETKSGYCEHFAGATATLLRMSGVPTRIVLGYLGAEYNKYGGFYYVNQSRAHAWIEYLNDDQIWIRFDPTLWVQPNFQQQILGQDWLAQTFAAIENYYLFLNFAWNKFLIDFDFSKQQNILQNYKMHLIFLFTLVLSLIVSYVFLQKWWAENMIPKPILYWNKFEKIMKHRGFKRGSTETPLEFVSRIPNSRAKNILNFYVLYRYSNQMDSTLEKLAKQELLELKSKTKIQN